MNSCNFCGRLTRDPELRYTSNQTPVCNATIAVDDYRGGEKTTMFLDLVIWKEAGEWFNRAHFKGQFANVRGRLTIREWEDRDGNKRSKPELIVEDFDFLTPKKDEAIHNRAEADAVRAEQFNDLGDDMDGELPF